MGLPDELAYGSLRLTISEETTCEEADYVVDAICETVKKLRKMSPEYEKFAFDKNLMYNNKIPI